MARKMIFICISLMICISFTACIDKSSNMEQLKISNIKIFKDTPAWELANAVKSQDKDKIVEISEYNPEILNYQDPKYGATLLLWAIGMEKYDSAKALLECGADPDIATIPLGKTPLLQASGYSWIDTEAKKDPKYVQLLLSYGADPNKSYIGYINSESQSLIEPGATPLMYSIGTGIEKTKALIKAGADINQKSNSQSTAAIYALLNNRDPRYAYYLIVEKKAIISEPYFSRIILSGDNPNKEFYPVDILRNWIFALDSEEYKMKMEIVKEFERQGVNYWSTEIPERALEKIKKLYPNSWEEVIKKY